MDMQTKAGIKKELLAFFRTKKFFILALIVIGWSILSPLIMYGMSGFMGLMGDVYTDLGMDISGLTDEFNSYATYGVTSQITDTASTSLLVFLLLIASFSGGEQKKRSIIIPKSVGLTNYSYLLPKFIIYPLTAFIFAFIGTFAAGFISINIFRTNDIYFPYLLTSGLLLGIYCMFYACLYITIGTATGKPWIGNTVCILSLLLLPSIFAVVNASHAYNPFTLSSASISALYGLEATGDIIIGIIITFALMAALFYISLFAQNAKKIDNSGNEILI
jgi:hypothetical protein